jgi:DNA polymerase I
MPLVCTAQIEQHRRAHRCDMLFAAEPRIEETMREVERGARRGGHPNSISVSPKQLQEILFEKQGLPVKRKTPKGSRPPRRMCLQELADDYALPR